MNERCLMGEFTGKVVIVTGGAHGRWNTEITACDALYLQKIGVELEK
jgi:hypothetical protein